MIVNVCVGSSCHLKGSYDIINRLNELIGENNIGNKVQVKAAFCLGDCSTGVGMKINDKPVSNVSIETIDTIFNERILGQI